MMGLSLIQLYRQSSDMKLDTIAGSHPNSTGVQLSRSPKPFYSCLWMVQLLRPKETIVLVPRCILRRALTKREIFVDNYSSMVEEMEILGTESKNGTTPGI